MARLPYLDPASAEEKARKVYEDLPAPLNIFRMMLHSPTNMRSLTRFGAAVLGRQKLDPRLRELAILRVATLSKADYEWTQHVPIALACGAKESEISAVRKGDLDTLDPKARLVIRFTNECLHDVKVSSGTFEEAKALFSPQEIVELVIAIGFYMMIARFLETLEVDAEPAAPEMAASFRRTSG